MCPVLVATDVVPEEADGLHVGEERGGVRQQLLLQRRQETLGGAQVAAGESLEDVHIEAYVGWNRSTGRS